MATIYGADGIVACYPVGLSGLVTGADMFEYKFRRRIYLLAWCREKWYFSINETG